MEPRLSCVILQNGIWQKGAAHHSDAFLQFLIRQSMDPSHSFQHIRVPCADGTEFSAYFSSDDGHVFFMEEDSEMNSLDDIVYIMCASRK